MPPAGKLLQHGHSLACITRFGQNLAVDLDHRIRAQHGQPAGGRQPVRHRTRLGQGQPQGIVLRLLPLAGRLVEVRMHGLMGNTDLLQQGAAPGGCRGKDDFPLSHGDKDGCC